MDGKGRALDNVIIERFWRNLKYDDVYLKGYTTPRAARHGIAAYMHRYNASGYTRHWGIRRPAASIGAICPVLTGKTAHGDRWSGFGVAPVRAVVHV
jgi:hypothetical protein